MQVPPDNALDERFDLNKFQGRWYITAGLNPLFDTFPCQEHYFGVPKEGVPQSQSAAVSCTQQRTASCLHLQGWWHSPTPVCRLQPQPAHCQGWH